MTERKELSTRARSRERPRSGRAMVSGLVPALHVNGSAVPAEAYVASANPAPDLGSRFKASMSLVASTVALVAAEAKGRRGGLTATAACSFSVDPPLMLVCINRR